MPAAFVHLMAAKYVPSFGNSNGSGVTQYWKKWRVTVLLDPAGPTRKNCLNVIRVLHETEPPFLDTNRRDRDQMWNVAYEIAREWDANPQYTEVERVFVNAYILTSNHYTARDIRDRYVRERIKNAA